MKVVLSSHSSFYTGQKAHLVKKGEGSFTLKPGEKETLSMEVSPESYMDKVVLIIEENLTEILPQGGRHVPDEEQPASDGGGDRPILER